MPLSPLPRFSLAQFRHLVEILELDLKSITTGWTEGRYAETFEANEMRRLIRALFATDDYQREQLRLIA